MAFPELRIHELTKDLLLATCRTNEPFWPTFFQLFCILRKVDKYQKTNAKNPFILEIIWKPIAYICRAWNVLSLECLINTT